MRAISVFSADQLETDRQIKSTHATKNPVFQVGTNLTRVGAQPCTTEPSTRTHDAVVFSGDLRHRLHHIWVCLALPGEAVPTPGGVITRCKEALRNERVHPSETAWSSSTPEELRRHTDPWHSRVLIFRTEQICDQLSGTRADFIWPRFRSRQGEVLASTNCLPTHKLRPTYGDTIHTTSTARRAAAVIQTEHADALGPSRFPMRKFPKGTHRKSGCLTSYTTS